MYRWHTRSRSLASVPEVDHPAKISRRHFAGPFVRRPDPLCKSKFLLGILWRIVSFRPLEIKPVMVSWICSNCSKWDEWGLSKVKYRWPRTLRKCMVDHLLDICRNTEEIWPMFDLSISTLPGLGKIILYHIWRCRWPVSVTILKLFVPKL